MYSNNMSPQQEIDTVIENIQERYAELFIEKNIDELVQLYHPEAALVQTGAFGVVGHAAIREKLEPFVQKSIVFTTTVKHNLIAGPNAEYIVHEGTFTSELLKGQTHPYIQVFKKANDGKYLIYHDEFSL